jgi:TatD DNase family protein
MHPFVDVHTHSIRPADGIVIRNMIIGVDEQPSAPFSAGIHPRFISDEKAQNDRLQNIIQQQGICAIGECGLDTLSDTDQNTQRRIFEMQIALASEKKLPLIIHSVRSTQPVIQILKKSLAPPAVIIHGFASGFDQAQQFLENDAYLSVGKGLMNKNPGAEEVVAKAPINRLFAETDDGDFLIGDVYARIAEIRKTSIEKIRKELYNNYRRIFEWQI